MILCMYDLLIGFGGNGGSPKVWQSLMLTIWGMIRRIFNSIFNRCTDRDFNYGRKETSDEGESIFISESRLNQ